MGATPTLQNIDSVLTFLPYFESEGSHFYDLETDRLTIDPYIYSPQLVQFVETLYREGFIVPFDWSAWRDEAARYVTDPSLLDSADLHTLQKLLTTIVRADRFSSGHPAQLTERPYARRVEKIEDYPRYGNTGVG